MMSTPGRKRIQPILIDDDDDDEEEEIEFATANENLICRSPSSIDKNIEHDLASTPNPCLSLADSKSSSRKHIYVALNFDELSHIRNAQSNSEFSSLLYDFQLYKDVVNGHLCFSCRKVKFSIFQPGHRCAICLQRICSKCRRLLTHRSDKICFVSLNLLRRSSIAMNHFPDSLTIEQNEQKLPDSTSTIVIPTNKPKRGYRTKLSNNSFTCCMDCFILFDPNSLVR